jgi:NDP-sugar pyrophosphorylase family protein
LWSTAAPGPAPAATLKNPTCVAIDGGGNLLIADSMNHVVRQVAAGPGIINAGSYVLGRGQLDDVDIPPPFSFENDCLARWLPVSPFHLFVADGLFIDIGVPEDFARAQDLLAGV